MTIAIAVAGIVFIVVVAIVVGIVDAVRAPRWRQIAAERNEIEAERNQLEQEAARLATLRDQVGRVDAETWVAARRELLEGRRQESAA